MWSVRGVVGKKSFDPVRAPTIPFEFVRGCLARPLLRSNAVCDVGDELSFACETENARKAFRKADITRPLKINGGEKFVASLANSW